MVLWQRLLPEGETVAQPAVRFVDAPDRAERAAHERHGEGHHRMRVLQRPARAARELPAIGIARCVLPQPDSTSPRSWPACRRSRGARLPEFCGGSRAPPRRPSAHVPVPRRTTAHSRRATCDRPPATPPARTQHGPADRLRIERQRLAVAAQVRKREAEIGGRRRIALRAEEASSGQLERLFENRNRGRELAPNRKYPCTLIEVFGPDLGIDLRKTPERRTGLVEGASRVVDAAVGFLNVAQHVSSRTASILPAGATFRSAATASLACCSAAA